MSQAQAAAMDKINSAWTDHIDGGPGAMWVSIYPHGPHNFVVKSVQRFPPAGPASLQCPTPLQLPSRPRPTCSGAALARHPDGLCMPSD